MTPVIQRLMRIPGVGLLTATALVATVGHIHAFQRARGFASWLGLTPSERASAGGAARGSAARLLELGPAFVFLPDMENSVEQEHAD